MTETTTPVASPKKPRRRLTWFLWLLLLIALSALSFFGYKSLLQSQRISTLQNDISQAAANNSQQAQLLQSIKANVANLQSQQQKLDNTQNLNIAGYLIQLAHIELSVMHNMEQARQLLLSADMTLASDQTERAEMLKNAINADLAKLNNQSNHYQHIHQIIELDQQVLQLSSQAQRQFHAKKLSPDKQKGSFWQHVKHNLSDFKNLVVIHHNDKPIQPLLGPEAFDTLKVAVHGQLSLAQWAVASQQPELYRSVLNNAANWLNRYATQNTQAKSIADEIAKLASQPFNTNTIMLQSWDTWQQYRKD